MSVALEQVTDTEFTISFNLHFRKMLECEEERGAAFAVYHKGKPVVDLWGGYADFEAYRLRKEDSTSMLYSTSKALTAIVIAVLVDRLDANMAYR